MAIRIKNIEQFQQWDAKASIVYRANGGGEEEVISGSIEFVAVGPVTIRLQLPDVGKKPGPSYLLGTYEGVAVETVIFAIAAPVVRLVFEPSGEVWFRKQDIFQAPENPNPDETFTRMEKPGLYMDDLSIALHRQSVLQRIHEGRQNVERDNYTAQLERKLRELGDTVEKLKPKPKPEAEAGAEQSKPEAKPEAAV
ncbi:hypothetical protein [Tortoise microvirus 72]|nr:hypothetical protein [Tortoise microvirus 72]